MAIDIGSTVIKLAKIAPDGALLGQEFFPRDFVAGIASQVEAIVDSTDLSDKQVLLCSSANGGLRVGVVCLTEGFSGAALRSQVLLAGANPVFVCSLDNPAGFAEPVDILIVGGGIDCADAGLMEHRLRAFDPKRYRFSVLIYAGNKFCADLFLGLFPGATVIGNPLSEGLRHESNMVFEAIRRAYLDDLIQKEGIAQLRSSLSKKVRPTPEVVARGFQEIVFHRSKIDVFGPCILLDIGGATTDLHFTTDIVCRRGNRSVSPGSSVARYVFTDLGIASSRDSTLRQLQEHPRLYDLLSKVNGGEDIRLTYQAIRERDLEPSPKLLAYTCLFVSLDRFVNRSLPGLPSADLDKVAHIIVTGGAAQLLDASVASKVVDLLVYGRSRPAITVDSSYQIWIDGIQSLAASDLSLS